MAKASQVVILENEFYIIKAPNGKVLEVKDFNTENGAAIQLWSYAGHSPFLKTCPCSKRTLMPFDCNSVSAA